MKIFFGEKDSLSFSGRFLLLRNKKGISQFFDSEIHRRF